MSFERPEFIEQIRAEAGARPPLRPKKKQAMPPDPYEARSLFHVCTGNRWMELGERVSPPKMLFGEFWHQGEFCILFADTNVGKSILAVQIANSISRHRPINPFALQTRSAKVLYIDFELTTAQFCARYRDQRGNYNFSDKFFRADFDNDVSMPAGCASFDEFIIAGIEHKIQLVTPAVLVIDNITCLRGGTENASVALSLMKRLKALKAEYNLSILVLAHTPKRRNPCRPLSADDLQGSKLLINFADSAFAIGRSSTKKGWCYLKQIKQRSTMQDYGEDKVCLCYIWRKNGSLRFRFKGSGSEYDHLLPRAVYVRRQLPAKVVRLAAKGLTQRKIGDKLKISVGLVNKMVNG
ncbi:MAG: AAA family ATPase [Mucilaginibacter sp.]